MDAVVFSRQTDEWSTPQAFFDALDAEFGFGLDAAATAENTKCLRWLADALGVDWSEMASGRPIWLNPPYSKIGAFVDKAAESAANGCTVVLLIPSRTDTKWWHRYIWDKDTHHWRLGVSGRFLQGRLKFGDGNNSAPFQSVVIVMRPIQ